MHADGFKAILFPFFRSLVDQNLISEENFKLDWIGVGSVDFVCESTSTKHHPTGTCKVGTRIDEPALDKNFKVFEVSNTRVIDASTPPLMRSGNANTPTTTAAMIAVDKIAQEYSNA